MPINIGGDTSVKWTMACNSARGGTVKTIPPDSTGPGKYQQLGVDETPDGDQDFTISIEIPKDASRPNAKSLFVAALRRAAGEAEAAPINSPVRITITIPIEDDRHGGPNEDQIQIGWPSK